MFKSIFIFTIVLCLACFSLYFICSYLGPWFFRKRIAKQELPESWETVINTKHTEFKDLSELNKEEVRNMVKVFMAEKYLEPDSLTWDEQIHICSTLALSLLGKKHNYLSKLSTIRITGNSKNGQGFIELPSIESLALFDFKPWY